MNATVRGCRTLLIIIGFLVACSAITFVFMPSNGIAVAVPVIMVPGEPYDPTLPVDSFRWTNTLTATFLATLVVLIFVFLVWRSSRGWTREVPGRWQSWAEAFFGFFYNLTKQIGGANGKLLFPLTASIFIFLLATNWMKLLPGIESVGVLHCAEEGFSSYPMVQIGNDAYQLYNDQALNSGISATHETYEACKHWKDEGKIKPSTDVKHDAADRLETEEAALRERLTAEGADVGTIDTQVNALRLSILSELYPDATYPITAAQLDNGVVPYHFVITPFVRGATTDLNLTIGLALISVIAVQVYGVRAQGPNYFQKFVNLRALGNLGKKPLGAIDFVVGIIEIISEIGKIVSLAFRLFGNMFAGGILLIVMSFLVASFLPLIFIGLEVIITTVQALVFAVLTLVFASQAMEGHHGDEEHGHDEAHA
jgi:F-type H+-transporting ATPase subunit a